MKYTALTLGLLFAVAMTAALLPSCSGLPPITAHVVTDAGALTVTPAGGVVADIDARSGK